MLIMPDKIIYFKNPLDGNRIDIINDKTLETEPVGCNQLTLTKKTMDGTIIQLKTMTLKTFQIIDGTDLPTILKLTHYLVFQLKS